MKLYMPFLVVLMLALTAWAAVAAVNVVPANTVIPVTLDTSLSSATNHVGDRFIAHHQGANGGGFPEDTEFNGVVRSVTRASGQVPGQIDVKFVSARLPDGALVPITGRLSSLDDQSVVADQATGRLIGTSSARKSNSKFIAIGAGAGAIIGQISGKHAALGAILGAAAGYLYGQKQAKVAVGKDVQVASGTQFGVLLAQDASIPQSMAALPEPVGSGPTPGPGMVVTFTNLKPMMVGNEVLVPLRYVMNQISIPFDYDAPTKTISVSTDSSTVLHTVGTRVVFIDSKATRMDVPSRIVYGSVYVPASFLELLTNKTAYWNPRTGVMRLE